MADPNTRFPEQYHQQTERKMIGLALQYTQVLKASLNIITQDPIL